MFCCASVLVGCFGSIIPQEHGLAVDVLGNDIQAAAHGRGKPLDRVHLEQGQRCVLERIELRVAAPGHSPQTISVTPEHDQSVDVKLDKLPKPEKKPPRPKASGGIPSDLENPF